ncbi:MAG: FAD-binding protein [Candidatus Lokiarchaeota archaeon]|nr:FAD-binding protein [Candidatus Lokiarchaeota archaeon]
MNEWRKDLGNFLAEEQVLNKFQINRFFPLIEGQAQAVVQPTDRSEISSIVKIASKHKLALVPVSSSYDFHGSTLSSQQSIIIDMSQLNGTISINKSFDGMSVDIEPGLTFRKLNKSLEEDGFRVITPIRMPADTSVLSTYYGRYPLLEANRHGYEQDWMLLTYMFTNTDGEMVATGSDGLETGTPQGDCPFSPRMDVGRLILGGMGAFGIVSQASCKMKYRLNEYEFLFCESDNLQKLVQDTRKMTLSTEAAQSVLLLDNKMLAGLAASSIETYDKLTNNLPKWNAIFALGGESDLIEVERKDLEEAAADHNLSLSRDAPTTGLEVMLKEEFTKPTSAINHFEYDPHVRVEYYSTAGRLSSVRGAVTEYLQSVGVNEDEQIGFLMNSIELGRTYFCEYDIFYGERNIQPDNLPMIGEVDLLQLYRGMYQTVMDNGGIINVPRNSIVSELVYKRTELQPYYQSLRRLKGVMDPQNILHPSMLFNGEGGIPSNIGGA